MYEAESKVSQPRATASGIVNGCPAPKRCKGLLAGIEDLAAIIMLASRPNSYDSITSVGLPKANMLYPKMSNLFADDVTRSRCSPPCIGPAQMVLLPSIMLTVSC